MHSISPYFHENIQDLNLLLSIVRASASRNFNFTLFYHLKKPLYHYTIPFYNTSSIPNFYFSILLIKIIYLHNKIIYPKIQLKTKTQITTYYHHHHEQPSTYQPIIDPKPINPSTTTAPIKNTQPQHQKTHHDTKEKNPTTTKQTHHNIDQQPPRKTHKKTTTDLVVADLEIHQPWQQSHHANRQRRGRWRENREEKWWVKRVREVSQTK